MRVPARYAEALPEGAVRCCLCPKRCVVRPGEAGDCRVRVNEGGTLWADGYGRLAAEAVEPVEKKPFYHFRPGSLCLSVGTFGCNLHCDYCQNWTISQTDGRAGRPAAAAAEAGPVAGARPDAWSARAAAEARAAKAAVEATAAETAEAVAARAAAAREADARVQSVCFTFTEPVVSLEFVLDAARAARARGFAVLLKTNGFVEPEPWSELLAEVDAVNIDLKGLDDAYYARVLGGWSGPVRAAIEAAFRAGVHVEVTTLLVPGEFEAPEEVEALAAWLAGVSPDIPLHLPRFYPDFRRGGAPMPREALVAAREAARRHLRYVYLTASPTAGDTDTRCDRCGTRLVRRHGFAVELGALAAAPDGARGRRCSACGAAHAFR
ncbi:MAG: radical SAM protein [Firmicutes bacterium]|nr:radical SAM protein [Bacillota bacterium]